MSITEQKQLSPMKIPNITKTISSVGIIKLYGKIKELGELEDIIQFHDQGIYYTFNVSKTYDITIDKLTPKFRYLKYINPQGEISLFIWIDGSDLSTLKDTMISMKNQPVEGIDNYVIEGCKMHEGYYNAAKEIISHFKGINGDKYKNNYYKEMIFIGHSIGGAIAALAATLLRFIDNINVKAFTFGTPPCVCSPLDERINEENQKEKFLLTVCNTDDIVASKGHTIGVNIANFFWILIKNAAVSIIKSGGKISFENLTDVISGLYEEKSKFTYNKYIIPGRLIYIQDQIVTCKERKQSILMSKVVSSGKASNMKIKLNKKSINKIFVNNHSLINYISMGDRIQNNKAVKMNGSHRLLHGAPTECDNRDTERYILENIDDIVKLTEKKEEPPEYLEFIYKNSQQDDGKPLINDESNKEEDKNEDEEDEIDENIEPLDELIKFAKKEGIDINENICFTYKKFLFCILDFKLTFRNYFKHMMQHLELLPKKE